MRYANIYIYIFVLHRGFFQQPRPRVGIVKLGLDAPTWQYNDNRGACFVFACQGIEPCQANADAGTRRPQVRLRPPQVRSRPPGEIALLPIEIVPPIEPASTQSV